MAENRQVYGRALREPALLASLPEPASGLRPSGDDPARGWIRIPMPTEATFAEMGEAAENELMSELGWADAGEAAWKVLLRDAEVTDWSGAVRGKFYRDSDRSGEAGETGTGSTEGESAGPKGIAQSQVE